MASEGRRPVSCTLSLGRSHLAPSQQLSLWSPAGFPNSNSLSACPWGRPSIRKAAASDPAAPAHFKSWEVWTLPQKCEQSPLNWRKSLLCTTYCWNRRGKKTQTWWFSSLHDTSWNLFTLERWWEKSEEAVVNRKHFLSFLNPLQLFQSEAI